MGQIIYNGRNYSGLIQAIDPDCYSTEEREVGCWTDGKPLYQKTCIFNPPFSSGNNTFNLNLSNECVIKNYAFFIHDNVSSPITIGQGDELKMINIGYANGINRAVVWIANGTLPYLSNGQLWITVQYTKTTDTAGSGKLNPFAIPTVHYSENEQVIGTWIDGSTLYQRVFDLGGDVQIPYNSLANTSIDASQMQAIIDAWGINSTGETKYSLMANKANNVIRLQTDRNGVNASVRYVILQYTKTS